MPCDWRGNRCLVRLNFRPFSASSFPGGNNLVIRGLTSLWWSWRLLEVSLKKGPQLALVTNCPPYLDLLVSPSCEGQGGLKRRLELGTQVFHGWSIKFRLCLQGKLYTQEQFPYSSAYPRIQAESPPGSIFLRVSHTLTTHKGPQGHSHLCFCFFLLFSPTLCGLLMKPDPCLLRP